MFQNLQQLMKLLKMRLNKFRILLSLIGLLLVVYSCYNVSYLKDEYLLYNDLIKHDTLKIDLLGTFSIKTDDFVYNRIQYNNDVHYVIIDLKVFDDLSLDSILINTKSNLDVGFSRFSNTISYNHGLTLEQVTSFRFDTRINFEFQDVSKIDTIFRTSNYIGFIYEPTKIAITNKNHKQQIIFNDSHYNGDILCLIYKKAAKLYLIQIKPLDSRDINFDYINTLNIT